MLTLYPSIRPFSTQFLAVDDIHTIYIEQSGNPDGIPIIFLHGGPGGASSEKSRQFFDPERYHIIVFDQRGCGKSKPYFNLVNNTTHHLIQDMETIRQHLNIDQWILFGGSWGSTLALLYTQQHPENVLSLILRGIFLSRQQEFDWLYHNQGAAKIFPDYWQQFISILSEKEQKNILDSYHKRLTGSDEIARMNAANHWARWENQISVLCPTTKNKKEDPHYTMGISRIEAHYFINDSFLDHNQIINNMKKINHIPGIIIHGRYDMVCTLDNALLLKEHWKNAELKIIRNAGHSAFEAPITDALIRATQQFAKENDEK